MARLTDGVLARAGPGDKEETIPLEAPHGSCAASAAKMRG